jgi:hypothetical protein
MNMPSYSNNFAYQKEKVFLFKSFKNTCTARLSTQDTFKVTKEEKKIDIERVNLETLKIKN